jgi:prolyl 4-hydroxylase
MAADTRTGQPAQQVITGALIDWLRSQLDAGCRVEDIVGAMRASGWAEPVARQAVQQVLPGLTGLAAAVDVPASGGPVPEPAVAEGQQRIEVGGHAVQVLMTMRQPRVVVFGGLLTDAECDALVAQAAPRLARSETVDSATGGSEVNAARTSRGMFFQRGETPLVQRIETRIAALLRWPLRWGEGLQVLHYEPGAEYKPHHDYFDPKHPGTEAVLARGGQRVGTLVIYLNTPAQGGATTFPDVLLEVAAVKGHAVFFSYDRPSAVTRTLHGGAPVVAGEKWVATKWLREREFN